MSNLSTPCRPAEFEPSWGESCGIFDPAPIPDTEGAKDIVRLINEHAEWLQAEPRSSLSIVFRLFPGSVRRMRDAVDMVLLLSNYLWSAGYVPVNTNTCNPTWRKVRRKRVHWSGPFGKFFVVPCKFAPIMSQSYPQRFP